MLVPCWYDYGRSVTYPLPSSLALWENIVAEMSVWENIVDEMGIDMVIRIIGGVLGIVGAQVYVEWTLNVDRRKSRSG